jgi:hypothetical protein
MLNPPAQNPSDPFGVNQPSPFLSPGQAPLNPLAQYQGPLPGQPVDAQQQYVTSVIESLEVQQAWVQKCAELKSNWVSGAKAKKDIMHRCLKYSRNQHCDGDLLPIPSSNGSDKDANKSRPQVFIPTMQQNLMLLHSQISLALFPNDEDYFRIRSKTAKGVELEDELTEGFKYLLKKGKFSNKMSGVIWMAAVTGFFAAKPYIRFEDTTQWRLEWAPDEMTGVLQKVYKQYDIKENPELDVQCINPLNFYIDPCESNPQRSKWFYIDRVKIRELMNDEIFINQDKLEDMASTSYSVSAGFYDMTQTNDTSNTPRDIEKTIEYVEYYFPEITILGKTYRNWIVGIAGGTTVVRNHPNLYPRGLNPAVFTSWVYDPTNPYGVGPGERMAGMQQYINLMENFSIEDMSRNSNLNVTTKDVDLRQFHPVAGGVVRVDNPSTDFVRIPYNAASFQALTEKVGIYKGEMQAAAGSQANFQGASNYDTPRTATEINTYEGINLTNNNQVKQHLGSFVEQTLTLMMHLAADSFQEPVEVPVDLPSGGKQYQEISFAPLKTGDFVIEMVSVNPAQSRQAQVEAILNIVKMVQDPESLVIMQPIIKEVGTLLGLKNIDIILEETMEKLQLVQQQQQLQQQQIAAQASAGAVGQPNVGNPAQAVA